MNVPDRLGPFPFPATQGIRLTNTSNAPNGVPPRLYSYWSVINNHAGADRLFVLAGRKGQRPMILAVDKRTLSVSLHRELPMEGEAEGWYFSDTQPHLLYYIQGNELRTFDISNGQSASVFRLHSDYGSYIKQAHSSRTDRVHSATVQDANYRAIGSVVDDGQKQEFFRSTGVIDECQIDKSGYHLVVQERVGEDSRNLFIDLARDGNRIVSNKEGALGHCDVGDKIVIGEDDQHEPGALVKWNLEVWGQRELLWQAPGWGPGMGHVACRDHEDLALLSSNWSGELLALSISGARPPRVIAPGLMASIPENASDDEKYDGQLRACVDPTGEWACWATNFGIRNGRFDLLMARIGLTSDQPKPPNPKPPTPGPGGSMKPLAISTNAAFKEVRLKPDVGDEVVGVPGTFDNRPAHLIPLADSLISGHGAELTLVWDDGVTLVQHGFLDTKSNPPRFSPDIFTKPTGF